MRGPLDGLNLVANASRDATAGDVHGARRDAQFRGHCVDVVAANDGAPEREPCLLAILHFHALRRPAEQVELVVAVPFVSTLPATQSGAALAWTLGTIPPTVAPA